MPKSTPGPWHANIDENYATTVTNAEGVGIARVIDDDDARLIAAAPQMLEALEELVELKDRRHSLPVEIYQESREKAWNKCRAAITAAKGEA